MATDLKTALLLKLLSGQQNHGVGTGDTALAAQSANHVNAVPMFIANKFSNVMADMQNQQENQQLMGQLMGEGGMGSNGGDQTATHLAVMKQLGSPLAKAKYAFDHNLLSGEVYDALLRQTQLKSAETAMRGNLIGLQGGIDQGDILANELGPLLSSMGIQGGEFKQVDPLQEAIAKLNIASRERIASNHEAAANGRAGTMAGAMKMTHQQTDGSKDQVQKPALNVIDMTVPGGIREFNPATDIEYDATNAPGLKKDKRGLAWARESRITNENSSQTRDTIKR